MLCNFSSELTVIEVNLEFVLPSPWTMKSEQNLRCFTGPIVKRYNFVRNIRCFADESVKAQGWMEFPKLSLVLTVA